MTDTDAPPAIHPAWSWALGGLGITGLLLAGLGSWTGWAVTLVTEAVWVVYATRTRQWGFLASAVGYAIAATVGLIHGT